MPNPPTSPPLMSGNWWIVNFVDYGSPFDPGSVSPAGGGPMNMVPTSRLTIFGHAGYIGTRQGGFIPPAVNYWFDMGQDNQYTITPLLYPEIIPSGDDFSGGGLRWVHSLANSPSMIMNGDNPWLGQGVVCWVEQRWPQSDVEWTRAYVLWSYWDQVLPQPGGLRTAAALREAAHRRQANVANRAAKLGKRVSWPEYLKPYRTP